MKSLLVPALVLLVAVATAVASEDVSAFNIPDPVETCLKPVSSRYKTSGRINPFYLRGDFDGDGRPDHAVLIITLKAERGVAICRAASRAPEIVGAGVALNKLADFDFDAWMVFPKGPVDEGLGKGHRRNSWAMPFPSYGRNRQAPYYIGTGGSSVGTSRAIEPMLTALAYECDALPNHLDETGLDYFGAKYFSGT